MLRNCACLVIAHMVDATQLCGGVGWGGVGMMTFFELEHMVDATQLCLSYHCTHGGCYATVRWGGVGCFSFGGTVQYIEESNIYLCFVVCRLKRGLVT